MAKEAAKVGFNEIQFDYVRFPASNGGKLDKELDYRNSTGESKPETIQKYLKYARKELEPLEVYISADIYGQVPSSDDDMGLGQHWEVISNEVDVISPMHILAIMEGECMEYLYLMQSHIRLSIIQH